MRYSFNIYKDIVLKNLQNKLGAENVNLVTVPKNNGVKLQGVQLNMGINMASPVMYFNTAEECYDDLDVMRFVEEAEKLFHSAATFSSEAVMVLRDWEIAKKGLRAKMINYVANKEYLKDKPFVRYLDLAVMFQISTTGIVCGCEDGVITVNNSMMKCWGIDKETLFTEAMKNLEQSDYRICSMSNMMECMVFDNGGSLSDETFCVATTYEGNGGASVILSTNILNKASERMNCKKFYIIPSSVHEILLIDCMKAKLEHLQVVVKDVNTNILDEQDVLADTVYIFDGGIVKIASERTGK